MNFVCLGSKIMNLDFIFTNCFPTPFSLVNQVYRHKCRSQQERMSVSWLLVTIEQTWSASQTNTLLFHLNHIVDIQLNSQWGFTIFFSYFLNNIMNNYTTLTCLFLCLYLYFIVGCSIHFLFLQCTFHFFTCICTQILNWLLAKNLCRLAQNPDQ